MTTTDTTPPADSAPTSTALPEPPEGNAENDTPPAGPDDDQHDDDDQEDDTRSNREKRYRLRLREAEKQRDEFTETLAKTRVAIVAAHVAGSGYAPKVAELVSADMDALLTDGLPDPEKIADALSAVVADFGFSRKARPPAPNHQQGHTSGHPGTESSWAGAIKGE